MWRVWPWKQVCMGCLTNSVNTWGLGLSRMDNVAAVHAEWCYSLIHRVLTVSQTSQPFAAVSSPLPKGKFRYKWWQLEHACLRVMVSHALCCGCIFPLSTVDSPLLLFPKETCTLNLPCVMAMLFEQTSRWCSLLWDAKVWLPQSSLNLLLSSQRHSREHKALLSLCPSPTNGICFWSPFCF